MCRSGEDTLFDLRQKLFIASELLEMKDENFHWWLKSHVNLFGQL